MLNIEKMSLINKFNEICRTCLKTGQLLTYLYDDENNINLVTKLKTCTLLEFDKNDQMPDKICPTCIEELLQAFNFINKCQISDATLKKYSIQNQQQNENIIKIEDPVIEPEKQMKTEIYDEIQIAESDAVDETDISIKDEFLEQINHSVNIENSEISVNSENFENFDNENFDNEENFDNKENLESNENEPKKRKTDFLECSVNLDKLNSTFAGSSSTDKTENDKNTRVKYVRKARSELYQPKKIIPKKKFQCPICPTSLTTTLALLRHVQVHAAVNKSKKLVDKIAKKNCLVCQVCDETSENPDSLMKHYIHHINTIKCEFCSRIYSPQQMNRHCRTHAELGPFKCDFCSMRFPKNRLKLKHQKTCTVAPVCTVCSLVFKTKNELNSHQLAHLGPAPFVCLRCKAEFPEGHLLIHHKTTRKCGRFLTCNDCEKIFQGPRERNAHKIKEHIIEKTTIN